MNAFSKSIKEIRVHLSKSTTSQGLRSFIVNKYNDIKTANPKVPILIREASEVESRVIARFDKGVEKKIVVDGLPETEVSSKFNELVSDSAKHIA